MLTHEVTQITEPPRQNFNVGVSMANQSQHLNDRDDQSGDRDGKRYVLVGLFAHHATGAF
jgi:hypothetical protein